MQDLSRFAEQQPNTPLATACLLAVANSSATPFFFLSWIKICVSMFSSRKIFLFCYYKNCTRSQGREDWRRYRFRDGFSTVTGLVNCRSKLSKLSSWLSPFSFFSDTEYYSAALQLQYWYMRWTCQLVRCVMHTHLFCPSVCLSIH